MFLRRALRNFINLPALKQHPAFLSHQSKVHCWNCKSPAPTTSAICPQCSKIINSSSKRAYLDLFRASYPVTERVDWYRDLDLRKLKKQYLSLQSEYHPDKASSLADVPPDYSSFISKAYETLKSPTTRLVYVLKSVFNVEDVFQEAKTTTDGFEQNSDFLEEMYTFHELVDEFTQGSTEVSAQKLAKFQGDLAKKLKTVFMKVEQAFLKRDFPEVVKRLQEWKYLDTISSRVDQLL